MARYLFTQNYSSSYGHGRAGDEIEFSAETAHAINRDAPGTLKMVREKQDDSAKQVAQAVDRVTELEAENEALKTRIAELEAATTPSEGDASEHVGSGPLGDGDGVNLGTAAVEPDDEDDKKKRRSLDAPPSDRMVKTASRRASKTAKDDQE